MRFACDSVQPFGQQSTLWFTEHEHVRESSDFGGVCGTVPMLATSCCGTALAGCPRGMATYLAGGPMRRTSNLIVCAFRAVLVE